VPSPGTVTRAVFPAGPGIRVDSWVQAGSVVPPFYDSLLAKLIVCGADRAEAAGRLRRALDTCEITGLATNLPLHRELVRAPEFVAGGVPTDYLARFLDRAAGPAETAGALRSGNATGTGHG
jgi:acetyl-CoA carboxylase biotin carboxylase subunit